MSMRDVTVSRQIDRRPISVSPARRVEFVRHGGDNFHRPNPAYSLAFGGNIQRSEKCWNPTPFMCELKTRAP